MVSAGQSSAPTWSSATPLRIPAASPPPWRRRLHARSPAACYLPEVFTCWVNAYDGSWHAIRSRNMEGFPMWKHSIGLAAAVLSIGAAVANAQEVPALRYEVGAQVTSPYFREFSRVLGRRSEIGVGGRFTLNLNNLLAAEAQVDLYPDDKFFDYRRKIQGLFGVRAGVRKGRVGVFAKVRPGFMHVRDRGACFIPEGCGLTPPGYTDDYFGRFW